MTPRPEVELWTLRLPAPGEPPPPLAYGELDAGERRRAAGFAGPRARLRYVTAHVALRRVLARHTGTDPARIRFGRGGPFGPDGRPRGRPVMLDAPGGPHFSLSHSHDLIVIAVAPVPVGADVQRVPGAGTLDAVLPRLHPAERAELQRLAPSERTVAFSRLWTRKEAYLKGLGTGLARGLARDCLAERAGVESRPAGWSVRNAPVPAGYTAATAVHGAVHPGVVPRPLLVQDCAVAA